MNVSKLIRWIAGILLLALVGWRVYQTAFVEAVYGPDTWMRFIIAGLIIGGMYALIAIGYTLVYGIMFMINFAHGEVMMIGAFGGYFVFEILPSSKHPRQRPQHDLPECPPFISVILAFIVGQLFPQSRVTAGTHRLSSVAQCAPSDPVDQRHRRFDLPAKCCHVDVRPSAPTVHNPDLLTRGTGWEIPMGQQRVMLTYTGTFSFVLSAFS